MARISVLEPHFEMLLEMYRQGKKFTEMQSRLKDMGIQTSRENISKRIKFRIQLIKRRQIEVDSLQLRPVLEETHYVKQGPLLPKTDNDVMSSSVFSVHANPADTSHARLDSSDPPVTSTHTDFPASENTKNEMLKIATIPAKKSRFGHLVLPVIRTSSREGRAR